MMTFVDHEQRRTALRRTEAFDVKFDELGCRTDNVPLTALERCHQLGPFFSVDCTVGAKHPNAEIAQSAFERKELVVRERAERIDDERFRAAFERANRSRVLKAK